MSSRLFVLKKRMSIAFAKKDMAKAVYYHQLILKEQGALNYGR